VTLIAFTLQQWLRERASMLRYTYIASVHGNVRVTSFENVSNKVNDKCNTVLAYFNSF